MMKLYKNLFVVVIVLFSVICAGNVVHALSDSDFENNMSHYESICYTAEGAKENKDVCLAFQDYINRKISSDKEELEKLQSEIDQIQKNITEYAAKASEYEVRIEDLGRQISLLEVSIEELEASIADLAEKIQQREARINEINDGIQKRLVTMQSFVSVNSIVDFIMGATDFVDLIRRIENIGDIQEYDNQQMALLNSEIDLLNADKAELEFQQANLEENKKALKESKAVVEGYKKAAEEIVKEYYRQKAILEEKEEQMLENLDEVKKKLILISDALNNIVPSPGWSLPIKQGQFRVSANTWHYPASFGGGIHLGLDMAAPLGTNIYAPANGVVLFSSDGCANKGYLTNSCGRPGAAGGGNQAYLVVNVNNKTYAIKMLHMKNGTVAKTGTVFQSGDKLGEVASSGNSTGNHLHFEVFYLGKESVNHYVQNWSGDFNFGTGRGSTALKNTCDKKSAPCRVRPEDLLGL